MAITTEFIDFIVPIDVIKKKYPGGWKQCLKDHKHTLGEIAWYDDYLFRLGAMSPVDIDDLAKEWEGLGFTPTSDHNGAKHWEDFCVHEGMFSGVTLPCEWLVSIKYWKVAHKNDPHPDIVNERPKSKI